MRRIAWLLFIVISSFSMALSQGAGSQSKQPDVVPLKFNLERNYTDLQRRDLVPQGDSSIQAPKTKTEYMTSHLTVRNTGVKAVKWVGWDYFVSDPATGQELAHYYFETVARLAPQSKETLGSAVKLSPDNGPNWEMYKNYKPKHFSERVVISYIKYADGSEWRP